MIGSVEAERTQHERIDPSSLKLIESKPWTVGSSHCLVEYAQFSQHIPEGSKIIEFGCGDGWLVGLLHRRGCVCTGVDINEQWLSFARKSWPGVKFINADWSELKPDLHDVVIWNGALHHALNIRRALFVSYHQVQSGGVCLINEPGLGHTIRPFTRKWHKQTGVTERDTPPIKTILAGLSVGWRNPKVYPAAQTLLNRGALMSAALCLYKWGHGFVKMSKP